MYGLVRAIEVVRKHVGVAVLVGGLSWGTAVQAATEPGFSASVGGSEQNPILTATLRVADADVGQQGEIYLAANVVGDAWFVHNGASWQSWLGGSMPAHASGQLADRSIEVARGYDASALAGTRVYLGYGRDVAEMFSATRYGLVYTVPAVQAEARTAVARSSAAVATADQGALIAGNRAFAFTLYQQLANDPQQGGNLFFSPLSISLALAMTYAGARGDTATEIANAMRFTLPQERLHPAFGWLDLELANRGQGAQGTGGQPFRLSLSNSLWGEQQASFETPFLDTLAQNYGAGIKLVDFMHSPDPSRIQINDWVAERTAQRIRGLLPSGSVDEGTRLVLVNAVYFNAAWQSQFSALSTMDAAFSRLDGATATVALMSQVGYFPYAEGSDYQAIELPYSGGDLAMLVVLPGTGRFSAFEQSFDDAKLTEIQSALTSRNVRLSLPKFKVEGGFSAKAALQALGMSAAFLPGAANFSGISTTEAWNIADIVHKGFVEVDETGTEAVAATGVVAGTTSVPPQPVLFRADRPFLFAIVDKPTNTLVFFGRFIAP